MPLCRVIVGLELVRILSEFPVVVPALNFNLKLLTTHDGECIIKIGILFLTTHNGVLYFTHENLYNLKMVIYFRVILQLCPLDKGQRATRVVIGGNNGATGAECLFVVDVPVESRVDFRSLPSR